MDRYEFVNKRRDKDLKRMYSTSRYPILAPTEFDTYIYAKDGMRLDNLAFRYYNDAGLWWIIALANNIGKGTFVVPMGMQVRIPSTKILSSLLTDLNAAQNDI